MRKLNVIIYVLLLSYGLNSEDLNSRLLKSIEQDSRYNNILYSINLIKNKIDEAEIVKLPDKLNLNTNIYGPILPPDFNFSVGTSISYTIYEPNKNYDVESYKILLNIEKERLKQTKAELMYNYYALLSSIKTYKEMLNLSKNQLKSREIYTEKVNLRFLNRDISKSELDYASSSLLNIKAENLEIESNLIEAINKFYKITGIKIRESDNLDFYPQLQVIKSTVIDPLITINNYRIDEAKLSNSLKKDFLKPTISASGTIKFPLDISSSWSLGLTVNFPIFTSEHNRVIDEKNQLIINKIEDDNKRIITEKKSETDFLEKSIKSIKERLILYEESLELINSSLEGVKIESKSGVRTVFDVINTENSLNSIKKRIIYTEEELLEEKLTLYYMKGGFH